MKRPSLQFYPADWKGNSNLRRCSLAARGAWVEVLCVLHDSDEYGIVRWPLTELAMVAGVPIELLQELVDKKVLKGGDSGMEAFTHTTTHARQVGDTHVLIEASKSSCWFSSRMVVDEWIKKRQGGATRFTPDHQPNRTPNRSPSRPVGEPSGDGATPPSTSPPTSSEGRGINTKGRASSMAEVTQQCLNSGLLESDGVWFWNKCEGNGWTNGGEKIKSWTHVVAAWKQQRYFPSQKVQTFNGKPVYPGVPKKGAIAI